MSNRLTTAHVSWMFVVSAGLTSSARAVEPSVVSMSIEGAAHSSSDSGTPPGRPEATVSRESSFERAFRLRGWSSAAPSRSHEMEVPVEELEFAHEASHLTPGVLDGIERWDPSNEFQPMTAAAADSGEVHPIPSHPSLTDRFFLGVGAYWSTSNTQARLDSPSGVGTTVDFEDLLGLDDNRVVPQGLARWRMSDRWRLELEYFELDRDESRSINGEIVWGDETYPIGTTIDSRFDFSVARLSCGYSFFKRQDKELGIALGFHLTNIEAELASSTGAQQEDGKLLAPLPVLSMYGQFAMTDLWALSGRLDAFALEYEDYSGHVFSIGIDALCQPWRHFGFGFGWRALDVEVKAESSGWSGEIQTNYSGPIAFASVSF